MELTREQVLAYRVHVQQLDRDDGASDAAILDLGVQDTGPDGALWAMELRGHTPRRTDLLTAWTLRGAPHVYRRGDVADVARATAPWSEADAAKRIFDASKPLTAAEIPVLDALGTVAEQLHVVVTSPMVKGEVSGALNDRLPEPYQRYCGPCQTVHVYEQPFRLSALQAGLELQPGTSPPVLQPIAGWRGPAVGATPAFDPIRGVLHFLGPATPKQVAEYVDSPVREVKARWPEDVESVVVEGERRSILSTDLTALVDPPDAAHVRRLLGPFDLFLQGRDRELVVPAGEHRKDLWRTLGRPGGVLVGHEVVGTWRPRAAGKRLRILVDAWEPLPDLTEQAERLAAFRGLEFAGFVTDQD